MQAQKYRLIKITAVLLLFAVPIISGSLTGCTNNNEPAPYSDSSYFAYMDPGAHMGEPGDILPFSAKMFNKTGLQVTPKSFTVSWSVAPAGLGTFSAGTPAGTVNFLPGPFPGVGTVTANINLYGQNYKAKSAVNVPPYHDVFPYDVLPSALSPVLGDEGIKLKPVYFGTENPVFKFSSSNETIVKTDNVGNLSFLAPGFSIITVSATLLDSVFSYPVPVLVNAAAPEYAHVKRLILPPYIEMFTDSTLNLKNLLRSENNKGIQDTLKSKVTWRIMAKDSMRNRLTVNGNRDLPAYGWLPVAISDTLGNVTARRPGASYIYASAPGYVTAVSELAVHHDTIAVLTPAHIDVSAGGTYKVSFKYFTINHSAYRAGQNPVSTEVTYIPTGGVVFPVTADTTLNKKYRGLVTLLGANPYEQNFKHNAGKTGNTFFDLVVPGRFIRQGIGRITGK
ncbi:MAG: hypothetical protein V4543_15165 [Bacteroidota bacterium]